MKISRLVNYFERSRSHARSEFTGELEALVLRAIANSKHGCWGTRSTVAEELEARKKDDPSSRPFTNSKI
ncbi:MAG: hypothetical protein ACK49D_09580 [Flavobacteriia bacterium]|jgi:hypothetical protein